LNYQNYGSAAPSFHTLLDRVCVGKKHTMLVNNLQRLNKRIQVLEKVKPSNATFSFPFRKISSGAFLCFWNWFPLEGLFCLLCFVLLFAGVSGQSVQGVLKVFHHRIWFGRPVIKCFTSTALRVQSVGGSCPQERNSTFSMTPNSSARMIIFRQNKVTNPFSFPFPN